MKLIFSKPQDVVINNSYDLEKVEKLAGHIERFCIKGQSDIVVYVSQFKIIKNFIEPVLNKSGWRLMHSPYEHSDGLRIAIWVRPLEEQIE